MPSVEKPWVCRVDIECVSRDQIAGELLLVVEDVVAGIDGSAGGNQNVMAKFFIKNKNQEAEERNKRLGELVAELEKEFGPPSEEAVQNVLRLWREG